MRFFFSVSGFAKEYGVAGQLIAEYIIENELTGAARDEWLMKMDLIRNNQLELIEEIRKEKKR